MIRNKNLFTKNAGNSSRDEDKYLQLPKIANASLPTAVADGSSGENEGGLAYDSTNNKVYFSDGSSWAAIDTAGSPALDDIADPDANSTVALAGYTLDFTSTLDAADTVMSIANTDADLANEVVMFGLDFTDDGDAQGVFLRARDNAAADVKFEVAADGNLTIAGTASGTDAIAITAGDITLTSGDVTLSSGDVDIAADNKKVSFGASGDTDSYIQFDGTNLVFFDSAVGSTITLSQLESASPTGDFTISDGQFSWTDSTAEQAGTFTFAGTNTTDIAWSSAITTGKGLAMTADALASGGSMIYLDSDGIPSGALYLRLYDGSANDLTIGQHGAVTIAGSGATDILTVTAGDLQITAGDIDLDAGKVEIDTVTNETSYVKRNQGVTTGPVFEIEETDSAADNAALLIDQNATTAASYALEIDSEGGTGIHFADLVAAGDGVLFDVADSYTGQLIVGDLGPWLGTGGEGAIELVSDSAATIPAGTLVKLNQQGTGQHASAIAGSVLDIDDAATAPGAGTSYAVSINATNIGALHVDAGATQLDGTLTVGVSDTGADVKFFGATANKFMVWDESADDLILADAVGLILGGDESTADGFKVEFDGTSTLNIDALTANDTIVIGATADTNFQLEDSSSNLAVDYDAGNDKLTIQADTTLTVLGDAAGTGITGLVIPTHATATPSGAADVGSIFFEEDANKLWVRTTASWVGVALA